MMIGLQYLVLATRAIRNIIRTSGQQTTMERKGKHKRLISNEAISIILTSYNYSVEQRMMHSAICLIIIQFGLMARVAATYPE